MIETSDAFLMVLARRHGNLPVLVIADAFPEALEDHLGRILYLGSAFPERPVRSRDFRFVTISSTLDVERYVQLESRREDGGGFALVFIDHHHRLDNLARQINAALTIAGPEALFLFDDSVPPRVGMAGPEPTEDWWVGEVWMLSHILRPAADHYFCMTADLQPTGLTAASGFAALDHDEIAPTYAVLAEVNSDEQLRELLPLVEVGQMFAKADVQLGGLSAAATIQLDPGNETTTPISRRPICDSMPWIKHPPEFYTDLSTTGHNMSLLRHGVIQAAAKAIDTFTDTYQLGFNGLIKDGWYFNHWMNCSVATLRNIGASYGEYANRATGIVLSNDVPVIPRERLATARPLDEAVMFGTPDEPDNWGMWLLIGLPSLFEFLENRRNYTKFMISMPQSWQGKMLEAAGLDFDDLIRQDRNEVYLCRQISMVRKSYRDMFITEDERLGFEKLRHRLLGGEPAGGAKRIFIARITRSRRSGNYRALLNEDELIAALEPLGFTVVEPDLLPFRDQVAAFAGADIVVGLGGAGMFNVIFCKPTAKIVTIESTTGFIDAHTNIFASLGLTYGVILGEEDATDPRPDQRRWTLNVPAAITEIRQFLD